MKERFRHLIPWLTDPRAEMAEAAITLPVVMLIAIFMINATMAGFASVNAANAANYGARVGSVTQGGSAGAAIAGSRQTLANAAIGEYRVSAGGGGVPGSTIVVVIEWSVPNYFSGLAGYFGASTDDFHGVAMATFRQEGW